MERLALARIWRAFFYSLAGLKTAFKNEAAFRQELLLSVVLIALAFLMDIGWGQRALLLSSVLIVLVVEILNSAIEAVVDLITKEKHPLAKNAKDLGSAAVLLSFVNLAVVWTCVLFSRCL